MGTYFRPWRRRFGVLALVMTCVFVFGWVRSLTIADWVLLFGNKVVVSAGQKIVVVDRSKVHDVQLKSDSADLEIPTRVCNTTIWFDHSFSSRFGHGYCTGIGTITEIQIGTKLFPYWSIVVPLSLISGWLLLSKPKQRPLPLLDAATTSFRSASALAPSDALGGSAAAKSS